jgi:hypothetical protein
MVRKCGSFLKKAMNFLGIAFLGGALAGCGYKNLAETAEAEPADARERRAEPDSELSLGYTHQQSPSTWSDSYKTSLRNRQNIGEKRWQADLEAIDQSDAVESETRASADFYLNNKGPHGFGLGFIVGNKQNEGSAAGHFSLGSTRISGQASGGSRVDESSVNNIDTRVENEYWSGGAKLRLGTGPKTDFVAGYNYNDNRVATRITGIPGADSDIDTESHIGYFLFSGRPSGDSSRLDSGYLGVLGSRICMNNEDNDADSDDVNVIGGASIRVRPGFSITPNFILGSQTGAGASFIFGPDTEHIADLYSQLREAERTAGNESEDYKNLLRQIQLAAESSRMYVLSLSGKKDNESDVENYELKYQIAGRAGRFGLGARYTHIPAESSEDIYQTDATLNSELRWGRNQLSIDLLIPTRHDNLLRGNIIYSVRF